MVRADSQTADNLLDMVRLIGIEAHTRDFVTLTFHCLASLKSHIKESAGNVNNTHIDFFCAKADHVGQTNTHSKTEWMRKKYFRKSEVHLNHLWNNKSLAWSGQINLFYQFLLAANLWTFNWVRNCLADTRNSLSHNIASTLCTIGNDSMLIVNILTIRLESRQMPMNERLISVNSKLYLRSIDCEINEIRKSSWLD